MSVYKLSSKFYAKYKKYNFINDRALLMLYSDFLTHFVQNTRDEIFSFLNNLIINDFIPENFNETLRNYVIQLQLIFGHKLNNKQNSSALISCLNDTSINSSLLNIIDCHNNFDDITFHDLLASVLNFTKQFNLSPFFFNIVVNYMAFDFFVVPFYVDPKNLCICNSFYSAYSLKSIHKSIKQMLNNLDLLLSIKFHENYPFAIEISKFSFEGNGTFVKKFQLLFDFYAINVKCVLSISNNYATLKVFPHFDGLDDFHYVDDNYLFSFIN